ncbi:MAG: hypothetical protein R6W93_12890 [Candidatus Limnocylindrales bacterium]
MPFVAYIDPGSGSMLLQVILAGVLAVPFFFRRVITDAWHRIRGGDGIPATHDDRGEETDSRA